MIKVIKRDGEIRDYNKSFIKDAVGKAREEIKCDDINLDILIADEVTKEIQDKNVDKINVEEIQDLVVKYLKIYNKRIEKAYSDYREKRSLARSHPIDKIITELMTNSNDFLSKENSNKKPELVSTQRDLMAGTISRHLANKIFPDYIMKAHNDGLIKNHDLDYIIQPMTNCDLIPLDDMFKNGTVINDKQIKTPKSLSVAMTLATQIITKVASFTYGGCTITLTHLAPFVRVSKEKIKRRFKNRLRKLNKLTYFSKEEIDLYVEDILKQEIKDSVQTFNYQISTMSSTNGQNPFVSVFIYLNEDEGEYKEEIALLAKEFFEQRIEGMPNEKGIPVTQTFPKLLFVLDEDNIYKDSEYYWLLELAMKCTALRQSPDYESAKIMKELYGDVFPCMGCRSFLYPFKPDGEHFKWYGRGNLGVCTINIPDIALSSKGDIKEFWKIFDDRMENLVKPSLIIRYTKLKGVKAKVAPILWEHGVFGRLNPDDNITDCIDKGGFSLSIGYAGISNAVKYMIGETQLSEKGFKLANEIMEYLENKANQWKAETGLGFSVYGSPIEETVDWFVKKLIKRFGNVKGVTDSDFIVNSYHIDPREEVDAFSKLEIEGKLQRHSKGGNVSYIETLGLENNIPALYEVLKCMYDNNTHAEINSQSDCTCYKCGYKGKMNYDTINNKWICPNCNNNDQNELSIILRTCGYLSNKGIYVDGRMADILSRKIHI